MDSLSQILQEDCAEFIQRLRTTTRGCFLFRGYEKEISTFNEFRHNMDFRKPRNTPIYIHDKINDTFRQQFGWNIRNGAFCYGMNINLYKPFDLGYGTQYLFFPVGAFDFVYSPDHFDLYKYIATVDQSELAIEKLRFKNDSLENAMHSGELEDGFSNEICVKTDEYFLINTTFAQQLMKFIWQ